jgi:uncharacterized protein (DUF427 family)
MDGREIVDDSVKAGAAQPESVWDYPRPPRLELTERHLRVVHAGVMVAETRRALRILETSHPPVYYFPPQDVAMELRESFDELRGIEGSPGVLCE